MAFARRLQSAANSTGPGGGGGDETDGPSPTYWAQWSNGPSTSASWFPIGVWLGHVDQTDNIIPAYNDLGEGLQDAGINTLFGTWDWMTYGPSFMNRAQALGFKVFPSFDFDGNTGSSVAYLSSNPGHASSIIGWQAGDEFDLFYYTQGYQSHNAPGTVYNNYLSNKAQDATRPQHINWGKPMGGWGWWWDQSEGEQNMIMYQNSCDATSWDHYWWTDKNDGTPCAYKYGTSLDFQRHFVHMAGHQDRPVWGFVENSMLYQESNSTRITPAQMEAAIWSMIVHGARGILYFIHTDYRDEQGNFQFLDERSIWANYFPGDRAAIIAKMQEVNGRITGLAPVLNSPELGTINSTTGREEFGDYVSVSSTNSIPVDVMVREYGGSTYVFAQASGDSSHLNSGNTTATFTWQSGGSGSIAVRDEARNVSMSGGVWTDSFTPYQMHIYILPN